jgi:hypothetical protein
VIERTFLLKKIIVFPAEGVIIINQQGRTEQEINNRIASEECFVC